MSVWFYTSLKDTAAPRHQETRPSWSELAGLEKVFEGEAAVTIWGGRRKDGDSFKTLPFLRLYCLRLYFFPSVVSQVGLYLLSRISRCTLRCYSLQGAFICWKAKMLFLRRLNNTGPGVPAFSACLVSYKESQSTGHVVSRKSIKLLTMKKVFFVLQFDFSI